MKIRWLMTMLLLAPGAALAGDEHHREHEAHEHGHGKLDIAIEGNKVLMELAAPGADIAGFEHEAATEEQKKAVASAKATLADPLALFGVPQDAGCSVTKAEVEVEHEEEDGGTASDKHAGDAHDHDDKAGKDSAEAKHNEFHAAYELSCTSPAEMNSLAMKYFESFSRAEQLSVSIVTEKSQSSYTVNRAKPVLDLGAHL